MSQIDIHQVTAHILAAATGKVAPEFKSISFVENASDSILFRVVLEAYSDSALQAADQLIQAVRDQLQPELHVGAEKVLASNNPAPLKNVVFSWMGGELKADLKLVAKDNIRRLDVFDGDEGLAMTGEFEIPGGGGITVKADQFIYRRFEELEQLLGKEYFDLIVEEQGYVAPKHELDTWKGKDNLRLYFMVTKAPGTDLISVVILSFGELQPGRYALHAEGIYDFQGELS